MKLQYFLNKLINWITRKKNVYIRVGLFLMALGFGGGIVFDIKYSTADSAISFAMSPDNLPIIVHYTLFVFGIIGFFCCITGLTIDYKKESRKINHIIQHIGVGTNISTPLSTAVRRKYSGKENSIVIDLSPYVESGKVIDAKKSFEKTLALRHKIDSDSNNSEDVTIIYGGTAQVPFTFLAGYIISNKNAIAVWDYNRDKQSWYDLKKTLPENNLPLVSYDENIDLKKFPEVCIAMSISYHINISDIGKKYEDYAIIQFNMPSVENDNMGSIDQMIDAQKKFRKLLSHLKSHNVKCVHIFCAAQSAFNFSMGRQIDRNMPECVVYQYDPSSTKDVYPWGVSLNPPTGEPILIGEY